MNQLINDLIEESKGWDDDASMMYGITPTVIPEDLVIIVVLECVRVCKENNAFVAADRIKKHFGIK